MKAVLRDHCHERPPVLTDHTFLAEGPTFPYYWTCHQRPPVLTDHIFFSLQERFYCTYLYLLPLKDYTFQAEGPTLQYNLPLETTLDYFRNHIFTVKAVSTVCSVQNVIMFFIRERKCQCCRIVNTVEHLHFNTVGSNTAMRNCLPWWTTGACYCQQPDLNFTN